MRKQTRAELVRRYRALVQSAPSDEALRAAMALTQDVLGVRMSLDVLDGEIRRLDEEEDLTTRLRSQLNEDILEYMGARDDATAVARRHRRVALVRRRLLTEAAYTMDLPRWAEHTERPLEPALMSLLLDSALLVFHQLYFGAWITLGEADRDLRDLLEGHAMSLTERLPDADRARIRALILESAGHSSMADTFRDEAVALTDPSSHEYMSVLQTAWAALVERRRFAQAMLLLAREGPRVPREHFEEFEEILLSTARSQRAA